MIDLLNIIFINLALSADNALIIGMSIRGLQSSQRNKVLIWTTIFTIFSYILFASLVTWLMDIPYIKLIGGILLIWVAIKMLTDIHKDSSLVKSVSNKWEAIRIIVLSNLVISFDNVLAISVIAKGNYYLIISGVLICITLLVFGSTLVAKLMTEMYILSYIGAGILAFSAISMTVEDPFLQPYGLQDRILCLLLTLVVLIIGLLCRIIKLSFLQRKIKEH